MRSRFFVFFGITMIVLHLTSCSPREAVLDLNNVTRYDASVNEQILFLEFRVSKKGGTNQEEMSLVSAVAGNGKMKALNRHVDYPYQIQVVPRYSVSALELAMSFPHPLYSSVEVPDPSGKITRREVNAEEGTFTMRLQADKHIEKLDFYSVKPGKGSVKIYTLNLKQ